MRLPRVVVVASSLCASWGAACGGGDSGTAEERSSGGAGGAVSSGGTGGSAADAGLTGGSGPLIDSGFGGGASECSTNAMCDGGVCVEGKCCAEAARVCGAQCCASGEVCSFDRCVVPGKACQGVADCDAGQFCEPALGDGVVSDAGSTDAGTGCTSPVPPRGRCLDMPPICGAADAGVPDGGPCVEKCEYKPPPGKLDAIVKWQWGLVNKPTQFPNSADVWATPTVGRLTDSNCDGKVDLSDPPNIVFVSGNANRTCCSCDTSSPSTCLTGVLRVLDGATGKEIWSLDRAKPGAHGFAGMSVALGDVDGDQSMDIVAMTGDGHVALIDAQGNVQRISDQPVDGKDAGAFGWGGGLALGDMDGDGSPEIAYGRTLFSTQGGVITRQWVGTGGRGGGGNGNRDLSFFADVDHDDVLELVAGSTVYEPNGSVLWNAPTGVADGFPAVADFDGDGRPEVVLVVNGAVYLLNGFDGTVRLGPVTLPGTGFGGPPTVADFDGDGLPEIGVAQQNLYTMLKPNFSTNAIDIVWQAPNHDLSSSVTGSSVFDFEGDGKAEVIYNDECFLWVYDGTTGDVLLATNTTSFTATEASLVADVDGDGHAEIVMVSNGADPSAAGWKCDIAPWNQPDAANNRGAWTAPPGAPAYRGITVYGDRSNSWVGTRTLWNQHAYSVSNVCDSRDSACDPPNLYGAIPSPQKKNWTVPWLNNFRQNVQDQGLFDAPDATVSLTVDCIEPPVLHAKVQNVGLAGLPSGVVVEFFRLDMGSEVLLGSASTTIPLLPGQSQVVTFQPLSGTASTLDEFRARIQNAAPKAFNECREDNNASNEVETSCGPK